MRLSSGVRASVLGQQPYQPIFDAMKEFTRLRDTTTPDEIWLLEHPPVYTQGQAGKAEHIVNARDIPIVQSDRGGQVTYHGPGQLIAYTLIDIDRRQLGVRTLVSQLEQGVMDVLAHYHITATTQCGAPGVYVKDKKIASIGLRVKNGRTYHGIALNVAMDLTPFSGINPCGYKMLSMTQVSDFVPEISINEIGELILQRMDKTLGGQP